MTTTNFIGSSLLIGLLALIPVSAFANSDIDDASLSASSAKPTLTGTTDAKSVRIVVENEAGKKVFSSRDIKAKAGKWRSRINKTLKPGTYEVTLFEKNAKGKRVEVGTETLSVSGKGGKSGTLSASMVPLLMGGTANSNASAPVAYVKLTNTGTATTSIQGFTLTENGTAPDAVVAGFTTSDDKGGSRATITTAFNKGSVFVPLAATLAPGQIRIFTIKANLGAVSAYRGTQLKIDVASVKTDGTIKGMFPLRGTTFTLGF